MATVTDKILNLTKQLYPTGRANKVFGWKEKLHRALAISEAQAYDDAMAVMYSVLPDNSNFTVDDAADWERRLGLIVYDAASLSAPSLAVRKATIQRKINHPGTVAARQHYLYLQGQLQALGFDVYVHENRVSDGAGGYVTENPLTLTGGVGAVINQHGKFQHGQKQHGRSYGDIVVNSLDNDKDFQFVVGANLRSTFFIGGSVKGTFANVDEDRRTELRQYILKMKPVQTVAFLFINYV